MPLFLKKFLHEHLWKQRHAFLKYAVVGMSGFVIDMGLLTFATETFKTRPSTNVLVIQIIMVLYIFLLNKYWSFGAMSWRHAQLVKFTTLAAWNYAFSFLAMYVFNELYNFHYLLVRMCSIALMVSWNFLLYRYWVYR